jgi:hypothetical protein
VPSNVQRQSVLHGQVAAHGLGALLADLHVGEVRTEAVRMTPDLDVHVLVVGIDAGSKVVERLLAGGVSSLPSNANATWPDKVLAWTNLPSASLPCADWPRCWKPSPDR